MGITLRLTETIRRNSSTLATTEDALLVFVEIIGKKLRLDSDRSGLEEVLQLLVR